jgi:tetratricopeptide (TPR) repeat protein
MKSLSLLSALVALTTAVFSQNTDSAKFYYQKAIVEKDAKRYLVAAKYFDKAIDFNPKYSAAYFEAGYVSLAMRKTDAARVYFNKLYDLDTTNITVIRELTTLYYDYHQYQKAIEFAYKCVGCAESERIIALCSYQQEDYATAVNGLLKVIAKDSTDAEAIYTIARAYIDMEEYTKAVPYYAKAITLDPTKNLWLYQFGLLYYTLNDFKHAKIFFIKAAENGYAATNDFNENLGYAYIYSGEFEKGEKLLLAIAAKKTGNKDIIRDIADAYYQQKVYDRSLVFCQKLLEMDANDGKALYQAGLCFQKKGQKEKGQAMCDEAIKMDPTLASLRQKMDGGMGL